MQLSIVTTLYKSSDYVNEFYQRIITEARKITNDYEIIFVDDGSPDDSLQKAVALHHKDKNVKVIELSRNFGHHKAIMTGLMHTKGEHIFLIDSDLEEPPELLSFFWQELHSETNLDVIYGIQKRRKGGLAEKVSGYIFWKTINLMSPINIPENIITARLMKKNYVHALTSYKESELFLGGIFSHVGYNQKGVEVTKGSHSPTTYTFKRKANLLINSITSFSSKPLIYIFYIGIFTTLISSAYLAKTIIGYIFFGKTVIGWASLITSVWFFGSLTILLLGIIGIYISRIFIEIKKRPYTPIRKHYED